MKGYLVKLSIVAGILCGLWVFFYNLLPNSTLMWMTFISLPIYFAAGAKRAEFPHYALSLAMGILWGWIYLKLINASIVNAGLGVGISLLIVVTAVTALMCGTHLVATSSTWVSKLPMMFGAVACMFSQGGNGIPSIFLTLLGGLVLALLIVEVTALVARTASDTEQVAAQSATAPE